MMEILESKSSRKSQIQRLRRLLRNGVVEFKYNL